MASQLNYFAENFRGIGITTDYPQRFMTIDSTGRARLCQPGELAEGVLENTQAVNDMPASVSFIGITKIQVDASYPIGTYLMAGTDGIGTLVTAGNYSYTRAKMIEASDASGDIVTCRLLDDQVGAQGIQGATGLFGPAGQTGIQGIYGQTGIQGNTGISP